MSVEITLPPFLQPLTDGEKLVDVSGSTVGECLDELVRRYPRMKARLFTKNGKLPKGINVFINRVSAYPGVLAKPVKDGDKLHITYLIVGG